MAIITIFLSSTDIIRLPIEFISFYRISLLTTLFICILYLIKSGEIKKGRYLYFIILIFISSPLAYFMSTSKEWALSFSLNDYMGILLIFIIVNLFSGKDINILLKTFIQSQFVTIIFSIYSVVMFYLYGGLPNTINLFGFLNIELSDSFLQRATAAGEIRLSLPYATPPHLSIITAVTICILLFSKGLFSNKVKYLLIIVFALILILTGSRTGIISAALILLLVNTVKFNFKFNLGKVLISYFIFLVGISITFILTMNSSYLDKFLSRFIITDILEDRHLLVPVEGILIWLSSASNFILGIGYGSSINLIGKFTFLPPYFLNSYVTLIAEKGILGLLIIIEFFVLFIKTIKDIKKSKYYNKAVYYSFYIILASFMFYEAKQNISVWIIISILLMLINSRKQSEEKSSEK